MMNKQAAIADLMMVNVDCAEPVTLAAFYKQVLGWRVTDSSDEFVMISNGSTSIGFSSVPGYQAPNWPDTAAPKRHHLDLYVDDVELASKACVALGATTPEFQPGGEHWRVLLDPSGQPFCLCPR